MYDCTIIGCGITGAAAAYLLSHYSLRLLMLEAANDVANGSTKANSAILHAGFDPEPGSLMARANVRGVEMAAEICRRLDVPRLNCGALVLAFSPDDQHTIRELYARGLANGVPGLRLLSAQEARQSEPYLADTVTGALLAPSSSIVDPWEYALAMAETAVKNGLTLGLGRAVRRIVRPDSPSGKDYFELTDSQGQSYQSRFVINAAGVHSDQVHAMIGGHNFHIHPVRGQYFLLDKNAGRTCSHTLFQCPTAAGKGVLVSPTVHGNLIIGPDAEAVADPDNTATTAEALEYVRRMALRSLNNIPFGENIRNFAGVRAQSDRPDFIVEASPQSSRFINLAGIKSPGLSAAPALAEMALDLLAQAGLPLKRRSDYDDSRRRTRFRYLTPAQQSELIAADPRYGHVVCRCETITEGEIVAALHGPIPPRSLDAVKRHCNAGSGRCQGSFCGPRIHEIIARELGLPYEAVTQNDAGSYIVTAPTKGTGSKGVTAC